MEEVTKPVRKALSTFLSWGKGGVIGYTESNEDDKMYVTKIWCKLCANYKQQLLDHPGIRGAAKRSVKAFTEGTNVVTKYQVHTFKLLYFVFKTQVDAPVTYREQK